MVTKARTKTIARKPATPRAPRPVKPVDITLTVDEAVFRAHTVAADAPDAAVFNAPTEPDNNGDTDE